MSFHRPLETPMYVAVGRVGEGFVGYTWRIWNRSTSFYLKCKAPRVNHLKLSLHSEDPNHPGKAGFKMAMDTEADYAAAIARGESAGWRHGDWPIWFPGNPLGGDATHVVRFRWTWDATTSLPPAPHPGNLRKGARGVMAPPPPAPGDAMDLDLIVSTGEPLWINEQRARRDNACLGPLRNTSDDWLTGTAAGAIERDGHAAGTRLGHTKAQHDVKY